MATHSAPVEISSAQNRKIINIADHFHTVETTANALLEGARLRMDALLMVALALAACATLALKAHGWTAAIALLCGCGLAVVAVRKMREEWKVLHDGMESDPWLQRQHLVSGEVDTLRTQLNHNGSYCHVAQFHFLTREGDFRTGMFLSPSRLPQKGEPILIAYDLQDPKRVRVVENFIFFHFPRTARG